MSGMPKEECLNLMCETSCPLCGGIIKFLVDVERGSDIDPIRDWLNVQSPETRDMIAAAQSSGLFSGFEQTVLATIQPPPKNIPKFFAGFIKCAAPMKLNGAQRLVLYNDFKDKKVEVLQHCRIAALIVDGVLAMFFPADYLSGNSLSGATVQIGQLSRTQSQFAEWRRTRMGYVPSGAAEYFAALQKRSIGAFANPAL